MAIEIQCRGCGQRYASPDRHAGKEIHCPACGGPIAVPNHAPRRRLADLLAEELPDNSPPVETDPFLATDALAVGVLASAGTILPTPPPRRERRQRRKRAAVRFSMPVIDSTLQAKILVATAALFLVVVLVVIANSALVPENALLVKVGGIILLTVGWIWCIDMALSKDAMSIRFWLLLSIYMGIAMFVTDRLLSALGFGPM